MGFEIDVSLDAASVARVKAVAREFAGSFFNLEMHDTEFDKLVRQITLIGNQEVKQLSGHAQIMLTRSTIRERAVTAITVQLSRLKVVLDRLTPRDDLLKPKKFLGVFSRGNPITSYFDRYRTAEADIETALSIMAESRDILLRDNISISRQKAAACVLLRTLSQAICMCSSLDERLEKLSMQLDKSDHTKAQKIRATALFEVRQRHGDLLMQMAVSRQSYAMLGMIEADNLQLLKGIDRASSTTISALQTAVVAAQTLVNQNLALDRIDGVNSAAVSLIARARSAATCENVQIDLSSPQAARQIATLRSALNDVSIALGALEHQQQAALSSV